ncbi:MAG: peptidoglycan DD-metalloendopeptidase family protein [Patescibacteria group bacterium]
MAISIKLDGLKRARGLRSNQFVSLREKQKSLKATIDQTRKTITELQAAQTLATSQGQHEQAEILAKSIEEKFASIETLTEEAEKTRERFLESDREIKQLNAEIAKEQSELNRESKKLEGAKAAGTGLVAGTIIAEAEKVKQMQANAAAPQAPQALKPIQIPIPAASGQGATPPDLSIFEKPTLRQKIFRSVKSGAKNMAKDAGYVVARPFINFKDNTVKVVGGISQGAKFTRTAVTSPKTAAKSVGQAVATGAQNKATALGAAAIAPAVNLVSNVKGIASTIKTLIKVIKALKILITSGTLVGAVANIALLFKDKLKRLLVKVLKIMAAIQALIFLLWLMLMAKLLGVISGLAFGLVTGLPLLAVPVVGPFLYIGWVGYWAWRGWVDPLATIHLATHPWEIITKPFNAFRDWVSNFGSGAKGGIEYVGSGVGNASATLISSAGTFATGIASSIWGGVATAAESTFGFLGTIAKGTLNALTSSGSAIAGNITTVAIGGSIASITTGTILAGVVTNSAFYTPEGDLASEVVIPGVNEFFTIEKTADPRQLATPGAVVTFTIKLTAKSQAIQSHTMVDFLRYRDKNGIDSAPITQDKNGNPISLALQAGCPEPTPIAPNNFCSVNIPISTTSIPTDSSIINTITVNATMADGTTKTDSATTTVQIGNPPANCPAGWPTAAGTISQGIKGAWSHNALFAFGEEAIDIAGATTTNTPTFATFTGTAIRVNDANDNGYGRFVDVAGNCNGTAFTARWAHLNSIDALVAPNQPITFGTQIGRVGDTGHVTGPHLHYSFIGLNMTTPYIPTSPPQTCDGEAACGVTY